MKKKRIFRTVFFILIITVLSAFTGSIIFFKLSVPDYSGELSVKGLSGPVIIKTDDHGIPHLSAQNNRDLFFAQGYITARERIFQMDIARLAGRGELSTLFGERALDKDKFLKTVGFYRKAAEGFKALPEEARNIIKSYTAGVNRYITDAKHLPREYFFLDAKPSLWEPEDSVAIGLLMSYSLTRSKKIDLIMYQAGKVAGDDLMKELIPHFPQFAPTLRKSHSFKISNQTDFKNLPIAQEKKKILNMVDEIISLDIPASNWMIFSGKKTISGKPLFSGSPDLAPTLPALFFNIHLVGGKFNAMGGSVPGVPGIGPLGFNGTIAWSTVNGRGDELDYFIEKINPKNPHQYLTKNGYRNFKIIDEILKIKDGDTIREEKFKIKISCHGPLVSEVMPLAPGNCAMQWAGLDLPCTDIAGLLEMNRAKNFNEFHQAHRWIRTMNLGFGYADKHGNIGWAFTSSPPIRKKGDGSVPVPGWTGEYDWKGFLPFEKIPWKLNPTEGYAASFNNSPGNVPSHMSNYCLFERSIRFRNIMKKLKDKKLSYDDIKQLQLDTISVVAKRWLPVVASACKDKADYKLPASILKKWNASVDINSHEATLFNLFYLKLIKNTIADDFGEKLWEKHLSHPYLFYVPDLLLAKILKKQNHPFFNNKKTPKKTESRDDIVRLSLKEAWDELNSKYGNDFSKWKWGKVHAMYFRHPLGSKLPFLNLEPIPVNGDHHTINSGFWDSKNRFEMKSGGVIRMIIDFGNIDNSSIISPPGQSGHFLSNWYNDTAELWAKGKQIPLKFTKWDKLRRVLTLKPE